MIVIKRFGVKSMAKFLLVLYTIIGIIAGAIIAFAVPAQAATSFTIIVVLYAVLGLISGAFFAWAYNTLAPKIGGVGLHTTINQATQKKELRRFDIKSVGKMWGGILFILAFAVILILVLILIGLSAVTFGLLGGLVGGMILFLIGLTILYGAMGFVFGIIGSFAYNIFAGFFGGVEIETLTRSNNPKRKQLVKIGAKSLGKILAALYFLMGLLASSLFLQIIPIYDSIKVDTNVLMYGLTPELFFIAMPFFYAIMGLVFGILVSFAHNLLASRFGGIEFETE
jgi:hypothetical protein